MKPEDYEGIRLYWAPSDIEAMRERLLQLGYAVSEVVDRDYGQTEFFVTDDDGHAHCFGVATEQAGWRNLCGGVTHVSTDLISHRPPHPASNAIRWWDRYDHPGRGFDSIGAPAASAGRAAIRIGHQWAWTLKAN